MSGSGLRERVVETWHRGRRLTTSAGLLLVLCSAWQTVLCGEYFRQRLHAARGGIVATIGSSWPMFDLMVVAALAAVSAVLVGVAVTRRRGPLRWAGLPVALLLAWAGLLWQRRDIGVRPIAYDYALDGSDSLSSTLLAAGVLALAVVASVVVAFAAGLVGGVWRWVALAAVAVAALGTLLMQAVPTDVLTPATAVAMFALSLAEPAALAALGVTLILGARSALAPASGRRASSIARSLPVS
jgi:hypothetical protein